MMDHHAMMWDAATRDLTAEAAEAAIVNALADLSGVRDFTHAAATRADFDQRCALAYDKIASVAAAWGTDPALLAEQITKSYGYVQAARTAAAHQAQLVRQAAAAAAPKAPSAPPAAPEQPAAPKPPTPEPGVPSEPPVPESTAKTSKPRTLPTGGSATAVPMPMPVAPGVAPGPAAMNPGPAAPGAQAAPAGAPKTAARRQQIEDDIAALNPHLPPTTIARLAKAALRHLAAEPLAYGNWDNPSDGPITNSIKNWTPPGGHGAGNGGGEGGAGLSPDDGDDSPAGPAAAGTAADAAAPAASAIADAALSAAASAR